MNNKHFNKFIQDARSIKMTETEKEAMDFSLLNYLENTNYVKSPYHKIFSYSKRAFALAMLLFISVGFISKPASSGSLPGDTLYPIKIIHEEITAASKKNIKKTEYEIERTQKRIQEVTALVKLDKLEAQDEKILAESIKEQATKAREEIKKVQEKTPEKALVLNTELKATIEANSQALKKAKNIEEEVQGEEKVQEEIQSENLDIPDIETEVEEKVQEEAPLSEENTEVDQNGEATLAPIDSEKNTDPEKGEEAILETLEAEIQEIDEDIKKETEPEKVDQKDEISTEEVEISKETPKKENEATEVLEPEALEQEKVQAGEAETVVENPDADLSTDKDDQAQSTEEILNKDTEEAQEMQVEANTEITQETEVEEPTQIPEEESTEGIKVPIEVSETELNKEVDTEIASKEVSEQEEEILIESKETESTEIKSTETNSIDYINKISLLSQKISSFRETEKLELANPELYKQVNTLIAEAKHSEALVLLQENLEKLEIEKRVIEIETNLQDLAR